MFMPICSGEHLQLGYYWPNCKWFLDCIFPYLQLGYSHSYKWFLDGTGTFAFLTSCKQCIIIVASNILLQLQLATRKIGPKK
jgi:hypothetical protein